MLTRRAARRYTIAVVVLVPAMTGVGLALLALSGSLGAGAVTPSELALTIGLTGSLILWHRPSNRIGMLLALTGVLFAVSVLAGGYSRTRARAVACRRGYASRRSQVPG